jgi:acyl-[acyl-carrier-protein]-phospholipid O-acyltransferase/long-chain-fatty-acid--[acyl-carrier-protein] ligase
LREQWKGQPHVGIMLPPGVPGALTNLAAALAGRTSVNLNYTSGQGGLTSAARQAGLCTVVTSRQFLEKAQVELPEGVDPLWMEAIAAQIGGFARWQALALAMLAPIQLLERCCGTGSPGRVSEPRTPPTGGGTSSGHGLVDAGAAPDKSQLNGAPATALPMRRSRPREARRVARLDEIATIIFSSGSSGEPKGVLLSHFNIDSNAAAAAQVFRLESADRLLGILPPFHSFGYMSFWLACNHGVGMVFPSTPGRSANWFSATGSRSCWPRRRSCRSTCGAAPRRSSDRCA